MGTLLQVCLGTVYAWSYFQKPICESYGWSNTQVAWVFSLAICFLGLASAVGGIKLPVYGPRKLAVCGVGLFGLGYLTGAVALHFGSLVLLYIGYGLIGGIGLGLGYVTPIATVARWFPDKKGLATGMVVMGFGFGALLMSKVLAPMLMGLAENNITYVFGALGIVFLVLGIPAAAFLKNPPADYVPAGYVPEKSPASTSRAANEAALTARQCVFSRKFALMWAIFFCNITAGIAIIGFQSPLFQDIWKTTDPSLTAANLASLGATLIAVSSIFNGLGRFFWGGLSDRIGRSRTFTIMLATQAAAFVAIIYVSNPWLFGILICYVLLCYGGGFGTMPSFVMDVFGARLMPVVYGAILTAWSCGGIAGPQLMAIIKDSYPAESALYSCMMGIAFLCVGLALSLFAGSDAAFRAAPALSEAS